MRSMRCLGSSNGQGSRLPHDAQSEAPPSPVAEQEPAGPPTRPTGVTVLAVPDVVGTGSTALAALATSFFLSGDQGGASILYLLFAVGYGLLGWGMWTLRGWARILHIIVSGIGLLGFPVGTIINAAIIYHLTRPHVGNAFSAKH